MLDFVIVTLHADTMVAPDVGVCAQLTCDVCMKRVRGMHGRSTRSCVADHVSLMKMCMSITECCLVTSTRKACVVCLQRRFSIRRQVQVGREV